MILVAGGTGTLGTRLDPLLAARGLGVRVLTRDAANAAHLKGDVQPVVGDVRDAAVVADAVRGCTAVVSAIQGFAGSPKQSPESIDRDANISLIKAAAAAGVEQFVLMSVPDAAADHPMSLHRAKYAAEQELRSSGLIWTIIRPSAYLDTWTGIIGAKIASNGKAQVFGPGRNPINFVAARDVAAVVDLALNDASLRGKTVDVGGPENLSFTDLAERLIAGSGRPGKISHVPLPMLRIMSVLARPISPMFARQAHAAVVMNTTDQTTNSDASRRGLPGVPTTTFEQFASQRQAEVPH